QVGVEDGSDVRRRLEQAFDHVLGDLPPQRAVRHAPARGSAGGGPAPEVVLHVLVGDAAATAGAGDLRQGGGMLLDQLADGRAEVEDPGRRRRTRAGGTPLMVSWSPGLLVPLARGFTPPARLAGRDAPEHIAGLDRLVFAFEDLVQHAAGRCRDLDHRLVGVDFQERLVGPDAVAGLAEPALDDPLPARRVVRGQDDVNEGHDGPAQKVTSSRIFSAICATLGRTAFISPTLYGIGTSGMVSRSTGASRLKNASRATTAATSAPKPAV